MLTCIVQHAQQPALWARVYGYMHRAARALRALRMHIYIQLGFCHLNPYHIEAAMLDPKKSRFHAYNILLYPTYTSPLTHTRTHARIHTHIRARPSIVQANSRLNVAFDGASCKWVPCTSQAVLLEVPPATL